MSAKTSILAPFLAIAVLGLGACVDPAAMEPELGSASEEVVVINNQTITELCVEVSDKSNAGTVDDIRLNYLTQTNDFWGCPIADGASRAEEACCTPTRSWKRNDHDFYEYFYVQFLDSSSTDGLRIGGVAAYSSSGTVIHYGTFSRGAEDISFEDCVHNGHCASYWIDGDDHSGCWQSKIELQMSGTGAPVCIH